MEQLTSIFQGAIKRYNISSPWVSREKEAPTGVHTPTEQYTRVRERLSRRYPTINQAMATQAVIEYKLFKIKSSEQQVPAPKISMEDL